MLEGRVDRIADHEQRAQPEREVDGRRHTDR